MPDSEHTVVVGNVKVTVRPDGEACADRLIVVFATWATGFVKLMVCAARATVMSRLTGVAAAIVLLPDWVAMTVQVPAAWIVSVVPLTEHTPDGDRKSVV